MGGRLHGPQVRGVRPGGGGQAAHVDPGRSGGGRRDGGRLRRRPAGFPSGARGPGGHAAGELGAGGGGPVRDRRRPAIWIVAGLVLLGAVAAAAPARRGWLRLDAVGILATSNSRAPGSVKIRTGGDSPRPDRSQRPVDPVKLRDRRLKSGWEAARAASMTPLFRHGPSRPSPGRRCGHGGRRPRSSFPVHDSEETDIHDRHSDSHAVLVELLPAGH